MWVLVISGSSVYKSLTALEGQSSRVVCNEDGIVEILAAHFSTVSSSNRYREDFLRRKDDAEKNALDFGNAVNLSLIHI